MRDFWFVSPLLPSALPHLLCALAFLPAPFQMGTANRRWRQSEGGFIPLSLYLMATGIGGVDRGSLLPSWQTLSVTLLHSSRTFLLAPWVLRMAMAQFSLTCSLFRVPMASPSQAPIYSQPL